jgi:hypothetical protein
MPGCFSRLSNKISKKKGEKEDVKPNDEPHVFTASKEPVTDSGAKSKSNDEIETPLAVKEPPTSPDAPGEKLAEKQKLTPKDLWRAALKTKGVAMSAR